MYAYQPSHLSLDGLLSENDLLGLPEPKHVQVSYGGGGDVRLMVGVCFRHGLLLVGGGLAGIGDEVRVVDYRGVEGGGERLGFFCRRRGQPGGSGERYVLSANSTTDRGEARVSVSPLLARVSGEEAARSVASSMGGFID